MTMKTNQGLAAEAELAKIDADVNFWLSQPLDVQIAMAKEAQRQIIWRSFDPLGNLERLVETGEAHWDERREVFVIEVGEEQG
jgi:hypothetical protein